MSTISQYEIRLSTDVHTLAQQIQKDISEGWQPLGGLQVSNERVPRIFQTIVKSK